MFRWLQKDKEEHMVNYVQDLIGLRKKYKEFRFDSKELIKEFVHVYTLDHQVIVYNLRACEPNCGYSNIAVYFNPNTKPYDLYLEEEQEVIFNDEGSVSLSSKQDEVTIKALSIVCLIKK